MAAPPVPVLVAAAKLYHKNWLYTVVARRPFVLTGALKAKCKTTYKLYTWLHFKIAAQVTVVIANTCMYLFRLYLFLFNTGKSYLLGVVFILGLQACGQLLGTSYHMLLQNLYVTDIPVVKPAWVQQKLLQPSAPPFVLLDTRTVAEFNVSHIKNARFAAFETFDVSQVKHIPKDMPVVVYCTVGVRSQSVAQQLRAAGYTQVYNLYGGLIEWVNLGFPVYNSQGQTHKTHGYSRAWGYWLQKGEIVYE